VLHVIVQKGDIVSAELVVHVSAHLGGFKNTEEFAVAMSRIAGRSDLDGAAKDEWAGHARKGCA
jgi:hypothetical protein